MSKFNLNVLVEPGHSGKLAKINMGRSTSSIPAYYKDSFEKYIKKISYSHDKQGTLRPTKDFFLISMDEKYIFLVIDKIIFKGISFLKVIYHNNVVYVHSKYFLEFMNKNKD